MQEQQQQQQQQQQLLREVAEEVLLKCFLDRRKIQVVQPRSSSSSSTVLRIVESDSQTPRAVINYNDDGDGDGNTITVAITRECLQEARINQFVFQLAHELLHWYVIGGAQELGIIAEKEEEEHDFVEQLAIAVSLVCLTDMSQEWRDPDFISQKSKNLTIKPQQKIAYANKFNAYKSLIIHSENIGGIPDSNLYFAIKYAEILQTSTSWSAFRTLSVACCNKNKVDFQQWHDINQDDAPAQSLILSLQQAQLFLLEKSPIVEKL